MSARQVNAYGTTSGLSSAVPIRKLRAGSAGLIVQSLGSHIRSEAPEVRFFAAHDGAKSSLFCCREPVFSSVVSFTDTKVRPHGGLGNYPF
jgi:hypothetical protein